jgi:multidrug resistance protein MdtO
VSVAAGAASPPTAWARFLAFLKAELAPLPGRGRASLRIVAACLAATGLTMGLHAPHGDWIVWTIFHVNSEDAGASLIHGVQRVVSTAAGAAVGLLIGIAFADEPQFLFAALGVAVAACMFLSRTTRARDSAVLAAFTLLLVVTSRLDSPGIEVETALWRALMILVGVVLGTGAQLLLWPQDPEHRLLDDIARRLERVEGLLARAAAPAPRPARAPDLVAASGLARELDLLANVEARYPSLRRRHTEQIALVTETERLLSSAVWLVDLVENPDRPDRLEAAMGPRLDALRTACARLRADLAARRPAAEVAYPATGPAEPRAGLGTLLAYMEGALARMAAATGFLDPSGARPSRFAPRRSPLDSPAREPFFTPAFSLANTADLKFALKCALAVEICLLIALGLDWPGLLQATATCAIVAQSSLGASVLKAFLRLAGAIVGGLLGLIVILAVMPNVGSLAWLMLPFAACFGIAAWLESGSSRIAYAGLQAGMAFGVSVLGVFGPTTDLVPPRDRVLSIVLGIAVTGVIYHWIWPVRASRAMRPALATAVRAMAVLAEWRRVPGGYAAEVAVAARHRTRVYHGLGTLLRLREESMLEPGRDAPAAAAERDRILETAGDAQGVFLALLALARHRLQTDAAPVPAAAVAPLEEFDRDVRRALEGIADAIEDREARPLSDPHAALETLDSVDPDLAAPAAGLDVALITRLRREVAIRRHVLGHLERLARRALPEPA